MVKKAVSNKLNYNNKIKTIKRTPKIGASISVLKDKNYNSKEDVGLKKRKELVIKKKEDKHDLNNNINKENTNGKGKCGKKNVNSTISTNTSTITSASTTSTKSLESSVPIVKTTLNNKQEIAPKRNCLSASSNSSYSSTSTNSSNSSNSTSESVKHLSPTQRAVHRKYCETVKLKNQKKQLEQQLDHQNSSNNNNNLKLFFKDKVVMLNIGTLTGKYFQIEAFWTDTIGDLKEIIQDKEGILKESQILIYQGKSLINDNYTLRDYNLQDGATLKLALQMSGGMKNLFTNNNNNNNNKI